MMEEKELLQMQKNLVALALLVMSALSAVNAQAFTTVLGGDTTIVSGLAWSSFNMDDHGVFAPGMTRAKVNVYQAAFSGCLEYDFTKLQLKSAWGGYNLPWASTKIVAGRFFIASGNDFTAPYDALFCWDPMFANLPGSLNDMGVKVASHFAKGAVNTTVACINGEGLGTGNQRPAVDGNVNIGHGGLYGSLNFRESQDVRYIWAVAQMKYRMVTIRGHRQERNDFITGAYRLVNAGDMEFKFSNNTTFGFSATGGNYREFAVGHTIHGKNAAGLYVIRDETGSWSAKVTYQAALTF